MINYRSAKPEEVGQIIKLTDLIFRESNNISPSMGKQFPTLLNESNASSLYIAEEDGNVVSHIGIKENTVMIYGHKLSMASMGAVCTHPDYQGRGIATKLLHETFENLHERGISLVTISGGRGLYRRNGAAVPTRPISFSITKELELPEHSCLNYRIMNETEDISFLSTIYYREPIRYQRTPEEFNVLLKAKPMVLEPDKVPFFTVVAYDKKSQFDNGVAYIMGYEGANGVFDVIEYAGERGAILGIVNNIFQEIDVSSIQLRVASHDKILIGMLKSIGIKGDISDISHTTVRVINKDSLWKEIYPIISEQWVGSHIPQSLDDLPVDMNDIGSLTGFLFGDYKCPECAEQWDIIFPLYLPCNRGLNFI